MAPSRNTSAPKKRSVPNASLDVRAWKRPKGPGAAPNMDRPPLPVPKPSNGGGLLSGGGLRVSLMPSEVAGETGPDIGKLWRVVFMVFAAELVLIGSAIYVTQRAVDTAKSRYDTLNEQISQVQTQIQGRGADVNRVTLFLQHASASTEALDAHVSWTPVLTMFEKSAMPGIRYKTFSGDASLSAVNVDVIAPSYKDASAQILMFRSLPGVQSVRAVTASSIVDEAGALKGVSFSLDIRLSPSLFIAKNQQIGATPTL